MPAPYITTPRTNDASYLSNGFDQLDGISPEKSFAAPDENDDLVTQMRKNRTGRMNLKTPRVPGRDALRLVPNGNQPQSKAEFTPLLRSVARTNISRRLSARQSGGEEMPSYLRNSYIAGATPGLPRMDEDTNLNSENTGSSAGFNNDYTPMPQNISSSAQSTPMVQLQTRDAVVNDGNVMTLREQESIIDKIEKENFGLKMKIHFLEEAIAKRGGEFNQAALKENTDLKVNRITMQRELHKFKKTLAQAEKDTDLYRQQLEEYKEKIRRKQIDESVRVENNAVKTEIKARETEIEQLRSKYSSDMSHKNDEMKRLRDDVEDLQAELRNKDRQIEEREDEIDILKTGSKKESNVAAELEDELESARQQIQELKDDLERAAREAKEAKEEQEDLLDEKRRAEQDLDELRDDIANKSFTEKGLSRRMDERIEKLRDENQDLQRRYDSVQSELEEKVRSEKKLQEQLREAEREGTASTRHIQLELESAQQQRDTLERKYLNTQKQMESCERDLQLSRDEKDLLDSRHDALTRESAELQKDLSKAQKSTQALNDALGEERRRADHNDKFLRSQHKTEIDMLNEQIDSLHRDSDSTYQKHVEDREEWSKQRKNLEAAAKRAEEKASSLQATIDELRNAQGTLSGREIVLQEMIETQNKRHMEEEKALNEQISDLQNDLVQKRATADAYQAEINSAREDLRTSSQEHALLQEKVIELEDEIEVLQADMEQEHEIVQQLQNQAAQSGDAHKEKRDLQNSLNALRAELDNARQSARTLESERDELEKKLETAHKSNDDTFDMQQEKREHRRVHQTLEKDVEKMRAERDSLSAANEALEAQIDAEIERSNEEQDRLNGEIDRLKRSQLTSSESRDRELASAKNKNSRLEKELQEARFEKELHEARLAQLKSRSPSVTPPPSHTKEIAQLRQRLVEAHTSLNALESENRNLKRAARRSSEDETDRLDLEKLLESTSKDAKELAAKLTERDEELSDLKVKLQRIRQERNEARNNSLQLAPSAAHVAQVAELKSRVRQLNAELDEAKDAGVLPRVHDKEVGQLRQELRRLRDERTRANQKAKNVEVELEVMQNQYENILERLSGVDSHVEAVESENKYTIQAKEMRGLIKEIAYLRARCHRTERHKNNLAWIKTYLEQQEAMRVEFNQINLRIIREMGIDTESHKNKFVKKLTPKQKFRAGVFLVIASIRMSKMEERWREHKIFGGQLKAIRRGQDGGNRPIIKS